MNQSIHSGPTPGPLGKLLRTWRSTRGLSQLALATELAISARHLSFIETGRSQPSRAMVMLLADGLDVPLRDRNTLLLAAGFAPAYRETDLGAPELEPIRNAITAILAHHEPYPAVVLNRRWDVIEANRGAGAFFDFLLSGRARPSQPNILHTMFDPNLVRPFVVDWERVARSLIQRVHREAVGGVADDDLLAALLAYPDVPARWRTPMVEEPALPVIPVTVEKDGTRLAYFSAVTTIGTAQDVTLQEVRIESFFPLDAATEAHAHSTGA